MTNKNWHVRFAPSPTGRLHLGHAYSAMFTWQHAVESRGKFTLRIEDIDLERCRPEFEEGIYEDLKWLGLEWDEPVRCQSEHFDDYKRAVATLDDLGLLYPCFCSRKDIRELDAPHGPEGFIYPGTCRGLDKEKVKKRIEQGDAYALRLDTEKALKYVGKELFWHDLSKGKQTVDFSMLGDVVLARKDVPTSYHLSVTVDDYIQGISLVTRGDDLFHATHVHRLLQELLQYDVPEYHHHGLMLDEDGKRFAKRNNAVTLQYLREVEGKSAEDIVSLLNL